MPKPSPSKNPFVKLLTPLERLRYNRTTLQLAHPRASQNSLLLNLPPELRNRIYELVLVSHDLIEVDSNHANYEVEDNLEEDKSTIKEPPLLRTCQIIRNEATPLYYSSNAFSCHYNCSSNAFPILIRWIRGRTPEKCTMLTDVRARCWQSTALNGTIVLPFVLSALEGIESELTRYKCPVPEGVIRATIGTGVEEKTLTGSEIKSLMDGAHWKVYDIITGRRSRNDLR
jgi:hypothetical protein